MPEWGTWDGGELYALPTPAPLTAAPECSSLLPTPTAQTFGTQHGKDPHRATVYSLDAMASKGMLLPTPTASEGTGPGYTDRENGGGRNLRTEGSLLPTPTARDWKDGTPCNAVEENALLGRTVWQFAGEPTDQRFDAGNTSSDDPPPDLLSLLFEEEASD